jgi:hypothetical protein
MARRSVFAKVGKNSARGFPNSILTGRNRNSQMPLGSQAVTKVTWERRAEIMILKSTGVFAASLHSGLQSARDRSRVPGVIHSGHSRGSGAAWRSRFA